MPVVEDPDVDSQTTTAVGTPGRLSSEASDKDMDVEKAAVDEGYEWHATDTRASLPSPTELEAQLRSEARHGAPAHGEDGLLEKRTTVDLGHGPEEVIIVEWLPNDPENPFNWSSSRKWTTAMAVFIITGLIAVNATAPGVMAEWGMPWFHTDHTGYAVSSFVYLFAIATTPLVLAPLSEMFGRNVFYQVTSVLNVLLFLPQILSHSYRGLLVARYFASMSSAVGNSLIGGTIADIFQATDRGNAMNWMSLFIFAGQSLGGVIFGWVGMTLGIQWCYGIQALAGALSMVINFVVLRETRADVLLARRAKMLTKLTGLKHICCAEMQKKSFKTMITGSAIRPIRKSACPRQLTPDYLFTEPIVTAIALWIGFAWGCIYLSTSSTLLVFGQYRWNSGLLGTTQACTLVGGILGFISNYHNEYLYQRAIKNSPTGRAAPEVRLYWAATGGLLFPVCLYGYAWLGRPEYHWIWPAAFLSLSMWGVYIMYSGVFNYLADAYETYSSSAQAAQNFMRNVFSAVFPLFCRQMYINLGYPIASTLVASVALVLGMAPIAIVYFGARLRARSKVACLIAKNQ